jgi:uncharacterized protein (UPF0548 family)
MQEMAAADVTYPEVGATAGVLPSGYKHGKYARVLTGGDPARRFEAAAVGLQTWQAHVLSGVTPVVAERPIVGATALFALAVGPVEVSIACRIIDVIDKPDQYGFIYGTLPLHPECGEERFMVSRVGDDVRFTIDVFWRSAHFLSTLGGPITPFLQKRATHAYLDALQKHVDSSLAQ